MIRRSHPQAYYTISPAARALIDQTADSLGATSYEAHSFRARVSAALQLAADYGLAKDELVQRVVDKVLVEVAA